jgi:hypothetical protein
MAYFTQGLLHVLAISNLQGSRGVALLLSTFVQCLANIIPGVVVDGKGVGKRVDGNHDG